MEDFKGEKLKKDLKTKKIYNYIDTEKGIDQLSREVYKNKDVIVHYPRGFEGDSKYRTIKKFTYKSFKDKLPVGVYKSENYGYGFTKGLYPFADYINENYDFQEVVIEKEGQIRLDTGNKVLYLNNEVLQKLSDVFSQVFKKNKGEIDFVLKNILSELFPSDISKPDKNYIPNALALSLASWGNGIDEFSDRDKEAIKELFEKLSLGTDFLSKSALAKTKEIVDIKFVKQTLTEFKRLMSLKTDSDNLEKQWQEFLKEHSWIFSSIFAQPVILYKQEAYVGGKTIDNQNGKFNDFLIKNNLSENVSFLEIKTHKTKLVESFPYRSEDVYSASKELSGCVVQVLNQRDNFQKEFYSSKVKSKGSFETFNSKCVVLIGSMSALNNSKKYSFELFRSNSRDVEILTFDELQNKIQSLQKIMTSK
jgi:hypothetical protein